MLVRAARRAAPRAPAPPHPRLTRRAEWRAWESVSEEYDHGFEAVEVLDKVGAKEQ